MSDRIATERIYRTADGTYVPHGHPDAAFLAVGVGGQLPADFNGFGNQADVVVEALPDAVVDALTEGEAVSNDGETEPTSDRAELGEPDPAPAKKSKKA